MVKLCPNHNIPFLYIIVSRGVGSPLPVGENFDSPLNFLPPGSSKTKFPPEVAFIISIPTNCQDRLTAMYYWSEKSSAYMVLKVSKVIYDFKIDLNKVKFKKVIAGVNSESISFSKSYLYHYQ